MPHKYGGIRAYILHKSWLHFALDEVRLRINEGARARDLEQARYVYVCSYVTAAAAATLGIP